MKTEPACPDQVHETIWEDVIQSLIQSIFENSISEQI